MGGCAGKNKTNYSSKHKTKSTKESKSRKKDGNEKPDSGLSSQSLPSSTGFIVPRDNNNNLADNNEVSIDSDIEILAKEEDGTSIVRRQPTPHTVIPVKDLELASELAFLVYGHPEREYTEHGPVTMTFKSTAV